MPGIYPHPSAAAENFHVGDQVRWYVNEKEISPYIGRVTEISGPANKVWVDFPVGGNQQKDPTELILVTPFAGASQVTEENGYGSYEKQISNRNYGTLRDRSVKLAESIVKKELGEKSKKTRVQKMASKVARNFAVDVVEKFSKDVLAGLEAGHSDIQTYQRLYPHYERICSDDFMRNAIGIIYKEAAAAEDRIIALVREAASKENIDIADPFYDKSKKSVIAVLEESSDAKRLQEELQSQGVRSEIEKAKPGPGVSEGSLFLTVDVES